jgi:sugar lactone lactonase YvrE
MKPNPKSLVMFSLLLLALLLAACGESAGTPVPATTTKAVTTVAATTAPVTTKPATTVATTVAATPTAVLTTVAPTTTPATLGKLPYLYVGNPSKGGSIRWGKDGALDTNGNLYIIDYTTRRLLKFDQDGKFKNFVEAPADKSDYRRPNLLATDQDGNLYVVYYSGVMHKFDKNGKSLGDFGDRKLGSVYSIASDKAGNIYTVTSESYLVRYDSTGKTSTKFQNKKQGDKLGEGEFDYLAKVRVDDTGSIYLYEEYDPARIQKFNQEGKLLERLEMPLNEEGKPYSLTDLLFDKEGNVLVMNYNHLWKFSQEGKLLKESKASFYNPQRLLLAGDSYILISSSENRTGKVDETGNQQTVIGASNSKESSQFEKADAVAVDKEGNFYVGDGYNSRIQKFNSTGKVVMTIDEKSSGKDFSPYYLALDKAGNIYAGGAGSITKFSPAGKPMLSFGKYGKEEGQFDTLSGLALDKDGNIYAGDSERGIIQKFGPDGKYLASFKLKQKEDEKVYTISMVFDQEGNLYVGRGNDNGILILDRAGQLKGTLSPNNNLINELSIQSLAIDGKGTLYAIESSSQHPVVIIDREGQLKANLGGEGNRQLEFFSASAIAVDEAGNIYVTEDTGARIQRWHPEDTTVKQGTSLT